jgi:hypothetical protein
MFALGDGMLLQAASAAVAVAAHKNFHELFMA